MVSSGLTRPRLFAVGIAVVALAFAACGHSNNTTPTPVSSVTPVATASAGATASVAPCAISLGIAYEPDGGNGGSLHGIQYTHFESNTETLCPPSAVPSAASLVTFSAPVGGLAFAADASDAVALVMGSSGGYTLAQDIFGSAIGTLTPVGTPYDLSMEPVPIATGYVSPGPSPTATATAANAPLISDAQSISILGGSSAAVALVLGTPVTGSTPAIVALTSLTNAPPQYGHSIPFTGSSYTLQNIADVPRNIVRVATDTTGTTVAVVRGPSDLLAFKITSVATGYQFNAESEDATLGSNTTLRGSGAMAFDPVDSGRLLVGGSTSGEGNALTLVTGLPDAINHTSTILLPGATQIRSIAITAAGVYAIVATDVGIFSVGGINADTLAIVPPFAASPLSSMANAPSYTTCASTTAQLTNVQSVGISSDQKFLVALGSGVGVACPSGFNASIVALPYNPATGGTPSPAPASTSTASPAPTMFVQNNIVAPPTGADLMYVH